MTWNPIYTGTGAPHPVELPTAPSWRAFARPRAGAAPTMPPFVPPAGLIEAVNAALYLRRPLMITGAPGSGKSTAIESVAAELELGRVLRWHITSRSTLRDGLYRYDALGRIHAQQLQGAEDDIAPFLQLGPLGTALVPHRRPRPLLIDEIDKCDLDLPGDLLDVLEGGSFEIPELMRYRREEVEIRRWNSTQTVVISRGWIQCDEFPFVVMTSNGERDFPPAFLRRCIRFDMPEPTEASLTQIVEAHLGTTDDDNGHRAGLIAGFLERLQAGESLAVDQLLNTVFLMTGPEIAPDDRDDLHRLIMMDLSGG